MASTPSKALAEFIAAQKTQYLSAVQAGNGKDWVVAMGNEAGGMRHILAAALLFTLILTILCSQSTREN